MMIYAEVLRLLKQQIYIYIPGVSKKVAPPPKKVFGMLSLRVFLREILQICLQFIYNR